MIATMNKGVHIFWFVLIALVVLGVGASFFVSARPGKLDGFARCLKDKGVVFYGAFWCPHCQRTKAMFGSSAKLLSYVECSTPDAKAQTKACTDKGIKSYPTWVFPNGEALTGERTLAELSQASGCPLPQ